MSLGRIRLMRHHRLMVQTAEKKMLKMAALYQSRQRGPAAFLSRSETRSASLARKNVSKSARSKITNAVMVVGQRSTDQTRQDIM